MTITSHIDELDLLLGSGADIARIRAYLGTVRQQAEAFEAHIRDLEASDQREALRTENDSLRKTLQAKEAEVDELQQQLAAQSQSKKSPYTDLGGGLSSAAFS